MNLLQNSKERAAIVTILNIIAIIIAIYTVGEFIYNNLAYVSVTGTAKYKIKETEKPAAQAIVRLGDEIDMTDDKAVFKIERTKTGTSRTLIFSLQENNRIMQSEKKVDIRRKHFWNANVDLGELTFEISKLGIIPKPKVELNGTVSYMKIDEKTKPVPGATLHITKKRPVGRTDPDGKYSIEFSPADFDLLIIGPDRKFFDSIDISKVSKNTTRNIGNFPRNFGCVKGGVKEKDGQKPARNVFINIHDRYFHFTNDKGEYFIDNIPFNKKHEQYRFIARRGVDEVPYTSYIHIDSYEVVEKNIDRFPPKIAVALNVKHVEGIGAAPEGISETFPVTIGEIFAWTDTSDIPGKKVIHTWYFGDKEKKTVFIPRNPPFFKAYSRARILPEYKGNWRVDIQTEKGEILNSLKFKVK